MLAIPRPRRTGRPRCKRYASDIVSPGRYYVLSVEASERRFERRAAVWAFRTDE